MIILCFCLFLFLFLFLLPPPTPPSDSAGRSPEATRSWLKYFWVVLPWLLIVVAYFLPWVHHNLPNNWQPFSALVLPPSVPRRLHHRPLPSRIVPRQFDDYPAYAHRAQPTPGPPYLLPQRLGRAPVELYHKARSWLNARFHPNAPQYIPRPLSNTNQNVQQGQPPIFNATPNKINPNYKPQDQIPDIPTLLAEFANYTAGHVPVPPALVEHSKEFEQEILEVVDGVYVAIGFGLANCIILRGAQGLVVVDTMESIEVMTEVWKAWKNFNKQRILTYQQQRRQNDGPHLTPPSSSAGALDEADDVPAAVKELLGSADLFNYKSSSTRQYKNSSGLERLDNLATLLQPPSLSAPDHPPTDLSDWPVQAIVYTHFHTDHTFGTSAIFQPNVTEIHAYWQTKQEMDKVFTLTAGTTYRRSMRQFGVFVNGPDFVNAGIGERLRYTSEAGIGTMQPTHIMYQEKKKILVAGIELELIHAPGESKDQIVVWYAAKGVAIGADNIYKSLPNIYAIRGTETRNCNDWIHSIDILRSLNADYLLLGHTRPVLGREHIEENLRAYRDAIQFIHDQTVRYMNKGYYLNDIAHLVKLPPHLESHPFLQPFYGTVPWAVRAIFAHYLGWFSGNPEDLDAMSTLERSTSLADLAGGFRALLSASLSALRRDHFQWALELAAAAHTLRPDSEEARTLRVLCLRAMASRHTAATGRNWLLTSALELEGAIELRLTDTQKRQALTHLNQNQVFAMLPIRLDAERAVDLDEVHQFHFRDTGESTCVHYRRGVAYVRWPCERPPDVEVTTTAAVWRAVLNKERHPAVAVARGEMTIHGSILRLLKTMDKLELDVD
eukprot:GHVT01048365.1.p1 GENE.GHVT01048365.1~~GHVT01048365.1.p1  ORF type:complete len:837 (-),score=151.37 GHVT01048365.1:935-3445(-)